MADFDDLVRTEAYLIWQAEGCPEGQQDRHWLMALERVTSRTPQRAEAPVIPISLKRIMLSARVKKKPQEGASLRASA